MITNIIHSIDYEGYSFVMNDFKVIMIHPQVHLRIPCYDFSFLYLARFTQILHSKLIFTKEQKQVHATNPKISPDQTSVGATGGVYKGQGRNQRKLLTCAY